MYIMVQVLSAYILYVKDYSCNGAKLCCIVIPSPHN